MVHELRLVSAGPIRPSTPPGRLGRAARQKDGEEGWQIDGDSAKSALLEILSREVRATLALVSGYSQTLLHLDLDDDGRGRCLARMSIASEHVAELTEAILSITATREDEGPDRQAVAISSLIGRLDREYAEEASPPRIVNQLPADLPLVSADPVWIGRVLKSFVSTVAGASADGRAVRVEARATGESVIVGVELYQENAGGQAPKPRLPMTPRLDRGASGEPSMASSRVAAPNPGFAQPATRLVDETARSGLDLCRQLVEAHGGRIWLNEVGSGLRLSFSLPRHRPQVTFGDKLGERVLAAELT